MSSFVVFRVWLFFNFMQGKNQILQDFSGLAKLDNLTHKRYNNGMKLKTKVCLTCFCLHTAFMFVFMFLQMTEVIAVSGFAYYYLGVFLLWIMYPIFFYIRYEKNKDKVAKFQQDYLDGLKPSAPLRFAPSDEELLKTYKEKGDQVFEPLPLRAREQQEDEQTEPPLSRAADGDEMTM